MIFVIPESKVESLDRTKSVTGIDPVEKISSFFITCVPSLIVIRRRAMPVWRREGRMETDKI